MQDGRCAFTNLILGFAPKYRNDLQLQTASLDRIDSSKGYVKNNVQWVHKTINIMKQAQSNEEFIKLCRDITNYDIN